MKHECMDGNLRMEHIKNLHTNTCVFTAPNAHSNKCLQRDTETERHREKAATSFFFFF